MSSIFPNRTMSCSNRARVVGVVHARVQRKIVPSQNEPLLSCNIQSSRYRKAFSVSHSQLPEINEDPEQLHSRHEMRAMFVAVVEENLKLLLRKNDIVMFNLGT